MTYFDRAFERTVRYEGGHSNDPADSGRETQFGITEAVARANGFTGPMTALTLDDAKRILKSQYWDILSLDAVAGISYLIAEELFDTSVNCGAMFSAKFLQRALNVLNREERDYQDVRVDGLIGPMTIQALRTFISNRGEDGVTVMLRVLNSLQGARYVEIAESRRKDEKFTFGWFKERVSMKG